MKKAFFGVLLVLIFFLLYVLFQLFVPYRYYFRPRVIEIPAHATPKTIGIILKEKDLIRSANWFYYYVWITKQGPLLRAGTFRISPSMTFSQITSALRTQNGAVSLIKVTIPEGYNIREIAATLARHDLVDPPIFINYTTYAAKPLFESEFPFLKHTGTSTLEGYLFPDTYFFRKNESLEAIVRIMLKRFQSTVIPIWDQAPNTPQSPRAKYTLHEVLSIASIIEKEAQKTSDMPIISAVFYNRLRRGMALQSCPTVIYALGRNHKERVYYSDLRVDSPYNTYKHAGFPPSPIASMGLRAFHAALNPAASPYLFFVAGKNGSHVFSRTYSEHNKAQKERRLFLDGEAPSESMELAL